MEKIKLGVLVGPTASGKTALSLEIAKKIGAEIVSADSIQLYKGFDIGSAKPTAEERRGIAHHLLDVYEPTEQNASVARFQELARQAIEDIFSRGKFPLVVGGTGLYVNALTYPLNFAGAPSDPALRAQLNEMEAGSPGSLHTLLAELDPKSASRLHKNDVKRVARAIEVVKLTGRPIGEFGGDFENRRNEEIPYDVRMIGLTMPRELLYERIERRVDDMMKRGLLEEILRLKVLGVTADMPAMQGLGYKQLYAHLAGQCSLEEAVAAIKLETRRFAKRQITWFKRDKRIQWFDLAQYESLDALTLDAVRALEGGGEC
ncbi:MAG: tRNA (adenosine(37)-N6)-dimethylallyltransferase MiaA [Clostridiaceae bacterium]|nr:tRNA (adenosine(37)-N6)-dimethylallyltransferase MiaA [Eubacteriales bacterium]